MNPSSLSSLINRPSILAALIWLAGFVLAFLIPSQSWFIFLPDTLLLLGFIPLLLSGRTSWPWFVFAFGNVGIGMVLYVSKFFLGTEVARRAPGAIEHLSQYHVPLVWLGFGLISFIYGVYQLVKNLIGRGKAKHRPN